MQILDFLVCRLGTGEIYQENVLEVCVCRSYEYLINYTLNCSWEYSKPPHKKDFYAHLINEALGTDVRKLSNTVHPSASRRIPCVAACFNKFDVLPPLHVIVLQHLLHFAMSNPWL